MMEQFVREYAAYKIRNTEKNSLMMWQYKDEIIRIVSGVLARAELGQLSEEEAIGMILTAETFATHKVNKREDA